MFITDIYKESKDSFSLEVLPPLRGKSITPLVDSINELIDLDPKFISVTAHNSDTKFQVEGSLFKKVVQCQRPGTAAVAARLKSEFSVPVVPHVVCSGNSKEDIEKELIDLQILGINNILCLRGDKNKLDSQFMPAEGGYRHAVELLCQVNQFNNGLLLNGTTEGNSFQIGVACYPEKYEESMNPVQDLMNFQNKVNVGAEFAITQMCFSAARILEYIDKVKPLGVTVIPGIKVLSRVSQLSLIPRIFHCEFPEDLYNKLVICKTDADVRRVGINHAIKMVEDLYKAGIPIVHFYTTNSMSEVSEVMKSIKGV